MKQLLLVALMAIFICTATSGQAKDKTLASRGKAERQLLALNQAWAAAITKGDAAALDRLFADDMIVTSGSGELRNKAGEIKDAAGGSADPDFSWTHPFTTEDVRV
ncbi:MAG TPA: nuclear transport factor 2 family protein, partial [Pyrinomonadaceae bacterium]